MTRIGIGGLHHETNSFAPQPATFERFVEADGWPPLPSGAAMLPGMAGINLAITGFIEAALAAGHELVPLVWANACPSGPVTEEAFERLATMLLADLAAAGQLDALLATCTVPWSPNIFRTARVNSCVGSGSSRSPIRSWPHSTSTPTCLRSG